MEEKGVSGLVLEEKEERGIIFCFSLIFSALWSRKEGGGGGKRGKSF